MPNTLPFSSTSVADARARSLALPPSRRIGIWPQLRKNHAVFRSSKYSALATQYKVSKRTPRSGGARGRGGGRCGGGSDVAPFEHVDPGVHQRHLVPLD